MNGFNIDPNFNVGNFENSINDFNKVFSKSLNESSQGLNQKVNFDEVFNSFNQQMQTTPIQGGVQQFVGMDSINAQKVENISPVAKMAKDIGSSLSGSINELNAIDKQAENDFETFASGGDISIHDVMISAQKSTLAMQMAVQLRNQMINTYNELKNLSF